MEIEINEELLDRIEAATHGSNVSVDEYVNQLLWESLPQLQMQDSPKTRTPWENICQFLSFIFVPLDMKRSPTDNKKGGCGPFKMTYAEYFNYYQAIRSYITHENTV